jgi:hypothetical protein
MKMLVAMGFTSEQFFFLKIIRLEFEFFLEANIVGGNWLYGGD